MPPPQPLPCSECGRRPAEIRVDPARPLCGFCGVDLVLAHFSITGDVDVQAALAAPSREGA